MGVQRKYKIAGIGELLWDMLPGGKQIGGAPFNFAYHAKVAGCEPYVISAVGRDRLGREIQDKAAQLEICSQYIQENSYPTSTVTVRLDSGGHPEYTIHEGVAWDYIRFGEGLEGLAGQLDAVCFGSLAQRSECSAKTIHSFLGQLSKGCLVVFDVNLRQSYYSREILLESLAISDMLKLNEDELPVLANYFDIKGTVKGQLKELLRRFKLQYLVYTMGGRGSIILSGSGYSEVEAPKVDVVDTVGAGDSFTATLVAGILQNKPIVDAHREATEVSAYVCTQKGAVPGDK